MIRMDRHCQVVGASLTGKRPVDGRTCASLAALSDRLERLYERVLIVRCQAGDEAAFADLVERYDPRLRYFVRRMLDAGDPDDVLQDIWLDGSGA